MSTQGGSYSWNAICKVCGFQYKGQDMRRRWDGLEPVCKDCWEPRHPMDFYRTHSDFHNLPWQTPAEDITPETGLGYSYQDDASPALYNSVLNPATYYTYFITRSDCRPVAFRFYHDGLYTQLNSPLTFTLWTKRDFEDDSAWVLRQKTIVPLLPNQAGWVEAPISQQGSGITFTNSDTITHILAGVRLGDSTPYGLISAFGGAPSWAAQTYLRYNATWYSLADNPVTSFSTVNAILPIDLIVKPEDSFNDVVYA